MRPPEPLRRLGPPVLLAGSLAAFVALVLVATAGAGFIGSDWDLLTRAVDLPAATLRPLDDGPALVPPLLYRLLLGLGGAQHEWLFVLALLALHATCVVLLWRLLARRVGGWLALVPAILLASSAPAGELVLASRPGVLTAVAAGLLAWLCLDHDDPPSDLWATGWLIVATACSPIGAAFVVAVAAELAWRRVWWERWWIVAAAALPLTAWTLAHSPPRTAGLTVVLLGLAGAAVLGGRSRGARFAPRAAGGLAGVLALASIGELRPGWPYAAAVLAIVALGASTRWRPFPWPVYAAIAAGVIAASASGWLISTDRAEARERESRQIALAVATLHITADAAADGFAPAPALAPRLTARGLRSVERAHGRIGGRTEPLLAAQTPDKLTQLDATIIAAEEIGVRPVVTEPSTTGVPLIVEEKRGGRLTMTDSHCSVLTPRRGVGSITVRPARGDSVLVRLPIGAAAEARLRRFAAVTGPPLTIRGPLGSGLLRLPVDGDPRAWHVQVAASDAVELCAATSGPDGHQSSSPAPG